MESTEYQNNYETAQGQNYQNFQNQENNISSSNQESKSQNTSNGSDMWYYLSIITWVLLLITLWTVFLSENLTYIAHSPIICPLNFTSGLISIIGAFGFYFYFKSTTLEKDQGIYQGMIGDMSKFHCVPLLLISIIIILTKSLTKTGCIFEIIFSILACAS